jgi:large subunit ribosomal protein L9e
MVLNLLNTAELKVPEAVKVSVKSRRVTVTGPLGTLKRTFVHATLQLRLLVSKNGKRRVRAELWSGKRQEVAVVRSVVSEIENLIKGVTQGFKFELKFVYAHFPINCNITGDKKQIEIRNYIGSRNSLVVRMLHGVEVARAEEKDTIEVQGIDLEKVSQSAASIQQACQVKGKDIRKFLDGVYVSKRGHMRDE